METKAKNIIKIEDFIEALFLKIKKVDAVELKYIIEDFEAKTNSEVSGYFDYYKLPIEVRNLLNYDSKTGVLEADSNYGDVKWYFEVNTVVDEYFENLDIEKLMEAKNQAYASYKERVLNEANVLLISNSEKEYQELLRFGFKNVDFFKSIIRANKYFEEHPDELNKYHIVLRGEKCNITDAAYKLSLLDKINHLNYYNHIVETYMSNDEEINHFYIYLHDYKRARTFGMRTDSYSALYERLAENAFINNVLEAHPVDNEKFLKYSDSEVKEKLPLPKNKSELKVLFLCDCYCWQTPEVKEYLKKLGLQLVIEKDDNNSLKNTILPHLGEYDIIIAGALFSKYILGLAAESTEQCKDTGRQLVLLADYVSDDSQDNCHITKENFISNIELGYVFAGKKALNNEEHGLEYRIVNQNLDNIEVVYTPYESRYYDEKEKARKKYLWSNKISQVVSIVEAAVGVYNQELIDMKEDALEDFDFKTPNEYYKEALTEYHKLRKIEDAMEDEVRAFRELMTQVKKYLFYKKEYQAPKYVEGLAISAKDETIIIQNVFNGRVLCEIEVQGYISLNDFYSFKMRVLSEKGTLMPPQKVGVYTVDYDYDDYDVPSRLNEKQLGALNATLKKVLAVLGPINQAAENDDRPLGLRKRNYQKRQ